MIEEKIQAQLRAEFNPDGSDLRNSQLKMLDILKCVDRICKKHNIKYWLSSGSLLGAVRHGGFIPWDDDLDIEIFYKDKNKFIKACYKELPNNYIIQHHKTDKLYCQNILKIRDKESYLLEKKKWNNNEYDVKYTYNGYFIDVFTEEYSSKILILLSRIPLRIMAIAQYKWKLSTNSLSLIYYLNEFIYSILRFLSSINPFKKYLYHTYGSWFISKRLDSEILPTKEILFEGEYFSAPNNVDAYLTRIYGNYMELPKSKNRKPSHAVTT